MYVVLCLTTLSKTSMIDVSTSYPKEGHMIDPKMQTMQQIINAVSAYQSGQHQPLADLVDAVMQSEEARRLLAQRGYGRESQALPELAKATPVLWW